MSDSALTSVEVINLPFRVGEWDEDGLIALNKNFTAIEEALAQMQVYMNNYGFTTINNSASLFESLVMIGLDAGLPKVSEAQGRKFYWATDTQKLYMLTPKE
jgi:hypothetical protein